MPDTSLRIHGSTFTNLIQLSEGCNNRCFRARGANGDVLIKHYSHSPSEIRDRLDAEYSMLSFLHENGITNVPKPLLKDDHAHTGVYGFIQGTPVQNGTVSEDDVIALADLLQKMYDLRIKNSALNLPFASDACFTLREYAMKTEKHLHSLCQLESSDRITAEIIAFVSHDVIPYFLTLHAQCMADPILYDSTLDTQYYAISPSDHGFHNSIRSVDGTLYFVDFEYSGWDDPAKMICDPLLQPDIPVPEEFHPLFIRKIKTILDVMPVHPDRLHYIYSILSIKWCCTMLTGFLPVQESRRTVSGNPPDTERKQYQLAISKKLFDRSKYHFKHRYITNLISRVV